MATYRIENCDTLEVKDINCNYPLGITEVNRFAEYPNDCWRVTAYADLDPSAELVTLVVNFKNCQLCLDYSGGDDCVGCEEADRTIAYSQMVKLPEPKVPNKGFKECCYNNYVFAELTGNSYSNNDFNSVYFKKQLITDGCDFVLIQLSTGDEFALNNSTYGQFWDFGDFQSQPNLSVYRVDWQKVLQVLGEGSYQIKKEMTVAGLIFPDYSNTFRLVTFSNEIADHTIRIDSVMNGELVHYGIDFKGTNYKDSIRTIGFFGNRDPKYIEDNLVRRNYDVEQISMSQENEYQFQSGLLPVCITDHIYDFMLFGNEIYLNDYNLNNHDYKYSKKAVKLESNKGSQYYVPIRDSRINLTFSDAKRDKRKVNC